jgi:hypothetical protein
VPFYFTTVNRRQPFQRFKAGGNHLIVCTAHARPDESLRKSSIGVRQTVLKPIPVGRMDGSVGIQKTIGK